MNVNETWDSWVRDGMAQHAAWASALGQFPSPWRSAEEMALGPDGCLYMQSIALQERSQIFSEQ